MKRLGPTRLVSWVVTGYGGLAVAGAILAVALGHRPTSREPWLPTSGVEAVAASLLLGLAFAALVLITTRWLFRRASWARSLHGKLRPIVRDADDGLLWLMAIASGFGEEIFFRGFLSTVAGVWLSSIAFGVLHQVRGAGRFGWALSAFGVGVALSVIYGLTGQLWGCIAAHVIINAVNLRYMRDHDPNPRPRKLGGLLRQT